jgi:hypothetical protein
MYSLHDKLTSIYWVLITINHILNHLCLTANVHLHLKRRIVQRNGSPMVSDTKEMEIHIKETYTKRVYHISYWGFDRFIDLAVKCFIQEQSAFVFRHFRIEFRNSS